LIEEKIGEMRKGETRGGIILNLPGIREVKREKEVDVTPEKKFSGSQNWRKSLLYDPGSFKKKASNG